MNTLPIDNAKTMQIIDGTDGLGNVEAHLVLVEAFPFEQMILKITTAAKFHGKAQVFLRVECNRQSCYLEYPNTHQPLSGSRQRAGK